MRLRLNRILRGAQGEIVSDVARACSGPVRVEDANGKVILGEAESGSRFELTHEEVVMGAVVGPDDAIMVSRLINHLIAREAEKRALAEETLERYKELTLLYNLSDTLSRVLDVQEVAQTVADEACLHLGAEGVVLLAQDHGQHALEPIASSGETAIQEAILLTSVGIETRVFETGHAEFVESTLDRDGREVSVLCAPLRSGPSVFGLMQATNRPDGGWTAAELKLLTSIAGNAAAAISHAVLHRNQMRQQTLRNRVERLVTEGFQHAVLNREPGATHGVAVYLDLSDVSQVFGADVSPESLLSQVDRARAIAIRDFARAGAMMNIGSTDTLVAVFIDPLGFDETAVVAHQTIVDLCETFSTSGYNPPGAGVARVSLASPEDILAGIGTAVELQVSAAGRILLDDPISKALGDDFQLVDTLLGLSYDSEVFEVFE